MARAAISIATARNTRLPASDARPGLKTSVFIVVLSLRASKRGVAASVHCCALLDGLAGVTSGGPGRSNRGCERQQQAQHENFPCRRDAQIEAEIIKERADRLEAMIDPDPGGLEQ